MIINSRAFSPGRKDFKCGENKRLNTYELGMVRKNDVGIVFQGARPSKFAISLVRPYDNERKEKRTK